VGYRPRLVDQSSTRFADEVHVARLRANGELAWDVALGRGYYPSIAHRASTVAVVVKVDSGAPQDLVLIDAASGKVKTRKRLADDVGQHCMLGTSRGWLLVTGPGYGSSAPAGSVVQLLDSAGRPRWKQAFSALNACDVREDAGGYEIAFTHPGNISETNYLFVSRLDGGGKAVGDPRRVPDVYFARGPRYRGNLLMYSGPLSRELFAIRTRPDLGTTAPAAVVKTYGLHGYGYWGESMVWSTDEGIGKRGCLERY
jgi:hypothetical protein